jgi:hypothetical protein
MLTCVVAVVTIIVVVVVALQLSLFHFLLVCLCAFQTAPMQRFQTVLTLSCCEESAEYGSTAALRRHRLNKARKA